MEKAFDDLNDWLTNSDMPNGKKNVLKAAIKLFSEQGYDGTSTAQIAKASGMSQATIFKYFKSKDDLLIYIIEPIIDHILPIYGMDFAKEIQKNNHDLQSILHFVINDRYQFLVANKDAVIILISQILINDDIRNMVLSKFATLKGIFLDSAWESISGTKELREGMTMLEVIRITASQVIFYFLQNQRILEKKDDQATQADLDEIEISVLRAIKK